MDISALAGTIAAVEFAIAPGIIASGDRVLLQSVLQNLLDNAWKFTGKQERSSILSAASPGRKAEGCTSSAMTGPGFDMQYAGKLFWQRQANHRQLYPGNAVGLAIAAVHHPPPWRPGLGRRRGRIGRTFYFTLDEQTERGWSGRLIMTRPPAKEKTPPGSAAAVWTEPEAVPIRIIRRMRSLHGGIPLRGEPLPGNDVSTGL